MFPERERPILAWLGRLLICTETRPLFGQIAARVFASPEIQQILFLSYFKNPLSAWEQLKRSSFVAIARFMSHIISAQPRQDYKIDCRIVHASLLNAIQLTPYDANSAVIPLIEAVAKFYMSQIELKSPKYRDFFGEFRIAVVPLFLLKVDVERDLKLLNAISCLLVGDGKDRTDFVNSFLRNLFVKMRFESQSLRRMAWKTFRKWILNDSRVEKCLRKSEELKVEFFELARIGAGDSYIRSELGFLIEGNDGDEGNIKKSVLKKSSGLIEGLRKMGLHLISNPL
jgi:hypothetical protein